MKIKIFGKISSIFNFSSNLLNSTPFCNPSSSFAIIINRYMTRILWFFITFSFEFYTKMCLSRQNSIIVFWVELVVELEHE